MFKCDLDNLIINLKIKFIAKMSIKKIVQKLFIYDRMIIDKRIGCERMKKFNAEKALRKIENKKKLKSVSKYVGIVGSFLVIGFIGIYFAYSKFFVSQDTEVVKTTVGNFLYGDVIISSYINGTYSSIVPTKDEGYTVSSVSCDNGATGTWDNDKWGVLVTNLSQRTKCSVYFTK